MGVICKHCGIVDDYYIIKKSNQDTAWCNGCDRYIKNLPQGNPPELHFGKYKDKLISNMISKEETDYLKCLLGQPFCKSKLKSDIENHLKSIANA